MKDQLAVFTQTVQVERCTVGFRLFGNLLFDRNPYQFYLGLKNIFYVHFVLVDTVREKIRTSNSLVQKILEKYFLSMCSISNSLVVPKSELKNQAGQICVPSVTHWSYLSRLNLFMTKNKLVQSRTTFFLFFMRVAHLPLTILFYEWASLLQATCLNVLCAQPGLLAPSSSTQLTYMLEYLNFRNNIFGNIPSIQNESRNLESERIIYKQKSGLKKISTVLAAYVDEQQTKKYDSSVCVPVSK